jgi:hypothetical protein
MERIRVTSTTYDTELFHLLSDIVVRNRASLAKDLAVSMSDGCASVCLGLCSRFDRRDVLASGLTLCYE